MLIIPNNPSLKSWITVNKDSDFPIQNLPFGIFKTDGLKPRTGVAIGDYVLDLAAVSKLGYFNDLRFDTQVFSKPFLNDFIALGQPVWRAVRQRVSDLLNAANAELRDNSNAQKKVLLALKDVQMMMPVKVGDYTDFYSSIDHATNMGKMLRDPANALLPNWKYIPVGYHGRASSIVVSGANFRRPKGQQKPAGVETPVFGPTKLLDIELETAFIIGKPTQLGESVTTSQAGDHIFGMVLFNDWSARDIQSWEYVPLGPFLAKNFVSVISPWVVTLDALEPYRVEGYKQEPEVFPYLQYTGKKNIDINLEVFIESKGTQAFKICSSNYKYMYWTMEQQLAHHTVNGCNINVGDLMASGTISGPDEGSFGSMMELTWRGTKPIQLPDGSERKFINDGDTVIVKGFAQKNGVRIGFGECKSTVIAATL
ncbi:MAG: fumarylacetoacetase [Bacteroidia bacterium]|nr:fumarylacetoacetase [Bacteroidia bacterium]